MGWGGGARECPRHTLHRANCPAAHNTSHTEPVVQRERKIAFMRKYAQDLHTASVLSRGNCSSKALYKGIAKGLSYSRLDEVQIPKAAPNLLEVKRE